MKKYDVILIGGGIAGLMSAYKLCEIGLSVALVENKKVFASGPSTRNEGWLHRGTYHATSILKREEAIQVAKRCIYGHEYIRRFAPEAIGDADKRPLALIKDESRINEVLSRWNEAGVSYSNLTRAQAQNRIPDANFKETAAIFEVDDVSLNTRLLYRKLIHLSLKSGCDFYLGYDVESINGQEILLRDTDGELQHVSAERIVYSSGIGAKGLFEKHHGIHLPIRYWKSHLIITRRLSDFGVFYLDAHETALMHHGNNSIIGFNEDALLSESADYNVIPDRSENIRKGIKKLFPDWNDPDAINIACVKVDLQRPENTNRSLNVAISEPVPGHILILPGKMTEAPYLTDLLVSYLHNAIDNRVVSMRPCDKSNSLEKIT
ncbi:FAD-dependent oxidoreductase [Prodigiosinella aquatilis]|nr:FAD-dependent oxidoreductase [Prodigiosinella sp. LS101]WJV54055.1 FAD-dependent oxidoreductase [Prodigiosinella sp. LS101]WJV58416.1 FAD-dependent oxidoreductase [Pectobacteriaceae bacterium C111]